MLDTGGRRTSIQECLGSCVFVSEFINDICLPAMQLSASQRIRTPALVDSLANRVKISLLQKLFHMDSAVVSKRSCLLVSSIFLCLQRAPLISRVCQAFKGDCSLLLTWFRGDTSTNSGMYIEKAEGKRL